MTKTPSDTQPNALSKPEQPLCSVCRHMFIHQTHTSQKHRLLSSPQSSLSPSSPIMYLHTLFHVLLSLLISATALFYNNVSLSKACNMYRGRWVYEETYPLYNVSACPFVLSQFRCLENGRPDQKYLKFKWVPKSCSLPK